MYFRGLFKRRLSIKKGGKLLTDYCKKNGFEDDTTQWRKPTHAKHWFSYKIKSRKMIARNWISYHYIRNNVKYSIWIDLANKEITEIPRPAA